MKKIKATLFIDEKKQLVLHMENNKSKVFAQQILMHDIKEITISYFPNNKAKVIKITLKKENDPSIISFICFPAKNKIITI